MERQRHVCVIDWFGVNYDGTMPTILLACDENWFALYAVWDIRYSSLTSWAQYPQFVSSFAYTDMGPRINSAPVSLVGCSDSGGFGFRNLIHHEGEAGPVGAIDDQSLFESCQDNILRGLALDMPAQYFFEK